MSYLFDFDNNIIEVLSPQTDVDVQDLYDACREAEDSLVGIQYEKIVNASGKESLGSGVSIGITVELLDWQLRFWSGNYIARIAGGNLVGGVGGDPVAYSPGVQVLLIQSAASTVVQISTGSGLSSEEHDQLMWAVATKTDIQNIQPGLTTEQNDQLMNTVATKNDLLII